MPAARTTRLKIGRRFSHQRIVLHGDLLNHFASGDLNAEESSDVGVPQGDLGQFVWKTKYILERISGPAKILLTSRDGWVREQTTWHMACQTESPLAGQSGGIADRGELLLWWDEPTGN